MNASLRKSVLRIFLDGGFQITPDALEIILKTGSPFQLADAVVSADIATKNGAVISKEIVEQVLSRQFDVPKEKPKKGFEPTKQIIQEDVNLSSKIDRETELWNVKIKKSPVMEMVGSEGTVKDFHSFFKDRFLCIKKIYMKRIDTQTAISIDSARSLHRNVKRFTSFQRDEKRTKRPPPIKIIGMVRDKKISRSRNIILELEDFESVMTCVVPAGKNGLQGQNLIEKGNAVLLDEVLCVSGSVDEDGRLIVEDIIFPDVPIARKIGRSKRDVYAAFISDIHCGSKEFLEDDFDRFIDWLRGVDVTSDEKECVSNVRYLFIAGDLCDGVGVYPEQKENLQITSLYDQYELLASKFKRIPSYIKIICIPGNHDACRQALPKPPISEEFAAPLYRLGNRIIMLGDPSQIVVEGVEILITHGDSLDDLITQIPGASYKNPTYSMKELLRKRHLVPIYGGKTEIAPLGRDWMVIESIPDIVHFGHAHHNAIDNYRGVQIINSGTFQSQTDFMRKQGVVPTPGIVTLVNLRSGAPIPRVFHDYSGESVS